MNSLSGTKANFILYVKDQSRSTAFYSRVFGCPPSLDVPGMTEFTLSEKSTLGLMPETDIKRLLGDDLPEPAQATGIPRSEIYLHVTNPIEYHKRAIEAGAMELSGLEDRAWGERAAYCLDLDGHVLAFAEKIEPEQK